MALTIFHKEVKFGVGDEIRITQKVKEKDTVRNYSFEGIVLGIRGKGVNKTCLVRRIGAGQIGIERIFPLSSPNIERIQVLREGTDGVRRAKLYYLRGKSKKDTEKIYSRVTSRHKKQMKLSKSKAGKEK